MKALRKYDFFRGLTCAEASLIIFLLIDNRPSSVQDLSDYSDGYLKANSVNASLHIANHHAEEIHLPHLFEQEKSSKPSKWQLNPDFPNIGLQSLAKKQSHW